MQRNSSLIIFISLISLILNSCNKSGDGIGLNLPKADFTYEFDPDMPGKINLINTSKNATLFFWEIYFVSPDGEKTYPVYMTLEHKEKDFYVPYNYTYSITLYAGNESGPDSEVSKNIEVINIPSKLTIGKLEITKVSLLNQDSVEWDNDGTYPDLILNLNPSQITFDHLDAYWDVDIENDLPLEIQTDGAVFTNLNPQTHDYFLELIDFDGLPGVTFQTGEGERMGSINIDIYDLLHKSSLPHGYSSELEDNYPKIYTIKNDFWEADLHMIWE